MNLILKYDFCLLIKVYIINIIIVLKCRIRLDIFHSFTKEKKYDCYTKKIKATGYYAINNSHRGRKQIKMRIGGWGS